MRRLAASAYSDLLRECKSTEAVKRLHHEITENGYAQSTQLLNVLVHVYGKCGSIKDARNAFESIIKPDKYSWGALVSALIHNGDLKDAMDVYEVAPLGRVACGNSLISAYGKRKHVEDARLLFESMQERNQITWATMLQAYAQNGHLKLSQKLLDCMPYHYDVPCTCLMFAYAQQRLMDNARDVFAAMQQRDEFPWVVMVSGYAQAGYLDTSRDLFRKMPNWNNVAWSSVITAHARTGHLDEARNLFNKMPSPDVSTWTSMITARVQNGQYSEALKLFKRMDLEGIQADGFTYSIALDACANLSASVEGRLLHQSAVDSGMTLDVVVTNAVINMYGKCAKVDDAVQVFQGMHQRVTGSWNALIAAHTDNGMDEGVFEVFGALLLDGRVQPDEITFTGVLTACSHTGILEDARGYFLVMSDEFGLSPTAGHYVCLSHLLGRLGRLREAEELLHTMPFYPNSVPWLSLVCACASNLDAERAERAGRYVLEIEPECTSVYILLSNMYRVLKRPRDAARIRQLMKDRGITNKRALSSVEVKGRLIPFAVPDELTRNLYR